MTEPQQLREIMKSQHLKIQKLEIALQKAHNDLNLYIRLMEPDVELRVIKQHFIDQLESIKIPIERVLLESRLKNKAPKKCTCTAEFTEYCSCNYTI